MVYEIYQIPTGKRYLDIKFVDLSLLKSMGQLPDRLNYEKSYEGKVKKPNRETDYILEDIFATFNMKPPKDFKGHSLSVSDVVVLRTDKEAKAYYVDSIGFADVTEYFFI